MAEISKHHDESLTTLSSLLEVLYLGKGHFDDTELATYIIERIIVSSSALIFFVYQEIIGEHFVLKILQEHKDPRYSWETLKKRQDSQQEALKWNPIFSPHFDFKLSNLCKIDLFEKKLQISTPDKTVLDTTIEYALIMPPLPDSERLDLLLNVCSEEALRSAIHLITKRLVDIHTHLTTLSIEEGQKWGSSEQLQKKLEHNLALVNPIFDENYETKQENLAKPRNTFSNLKENLRLVFVKYSYFRYFEQRLEKQYIKRCHGDLKCSNIWLNVNHVTILDAIDFNPMYFNIDTLSDFATFVVDVEACIPQSSYAKSIINQLQEDYLKETKQNEDNVARAVLGYYIIEKAFIGATISFIDDKAPDLGKKYLKIAKERLRLLMLS